MDITPSLAASFGFPKPQYTSVERERRWLCRTVPRDLIVRTERISDLYVSGTRLRLREARPLNGAAPMLRLSRKVDVNASTRLITSIYLPENELSVLSQALKGLRIEKLRHRLTDEPGFVRLVDEFQGALHGLLIYEVEFTSEDALAAYVPPEFARVEITSDARFSGGQLAQHGIPEDLGQILGSDA